MRTVYLSDGRLSKAHDFAKSRDEHFEDYNLESNLTGALGEFGTCEWLEENRITVGRGREAHPAFLFKDEQGEADVLVAGDALRIEIKSNAKGNQRYRIKAADEEKLKRKADIVLWCEVGAEEPDVDLIDGEGHVVDVVQPVNILGWALVGQAFRAPQEGAYRFMPKARVLDPDYLLELVHWALGRTATAPPGPPLSRRV